jgi:hypothetical protein
MAKERRCNDMKSDVKMTTTTTAPAHRHTRMIAAVLTLLALSLAARLTVLTGILSHSTATGASPNE